MPPFFIDRLCEGEGVRVRVRADQGASVASGRSDEKAARQIIFVSIEFLKQTPKSVGEQNRTKEAPCVGKVEKDCGVQRRFVFVSPFVVHCPCDSPRYLHTYTRTQTV